MEKYAYAILPTGKNSITHFGLFLINDKPYITHFCYLVHFTTLTENYKYEENNCFSFFVFHHLVFK